MEKWFDIGQKQLIQTAGVHLVYYELYKKPISGEALLEENHIITEEEIDELYYQKLQEYAFDSTNQKRELEKGDTIAITIACYDENDEFINTGYSPKGTVLNTVTLGTGMLISEIEEAIIGHVAGDIVHVDYKFSTPYNNYPYFAGKKISFDIQINSLIKELPSITDEWIQSNAGYSSINEFKNNIEEQYKMN